MAAEVEELAAVVVIVVGVLSGSVAAVLCLLYSSQNTFKSIGRTYLILYRPAALSSGAHAKQCEIISQRVNQHAGHNVHHQTKHAISQISQYSFHSFLHVPSHS